MFRGSATAIITPFDSDGNVDYNTLKKFIEFQIKSGIDALVVLGTTGEAPAIEDDEREKIINISLETANKRVPIIIGTGGNNIKKVLKNNLTAEKYGADGLLVVTPYYNKSTQQGLVETFEYICSKTSLDVILYNVPGRTGINMEPFTAIEIHNRCPNVKGVKEASGNISQIAQLLANKPETLDVYSGNDDQTLPIMAMGGKGVISVFSNVFPEVMKKLTSAVLSNDYETARNIHNKYLEMMNLLFVEVNPSPVKYLVSRMGYGENTLRLPLIPLSEKNQERLNISMQKLGGL